MTTSLQGTVDLIPMCPYIQRLQCTMQDDESAEESVKSINGVGKAVDAIEKKLDDIEKELDGIEKVRRRRKF